MGWFRKAFYWAVAVISIFAGLWLVVVNDQHIDLNLLIWQVRGLNAGAAVLGGFVAGAVCGVIIGLNLYALFKLKGRLFLLRRELKETRAALTRR